MSRRTQRAPSTRSSPPSAHTGPIVVSATRGPSWWPAAPLMAPSTTAPAKPPNTSPYTPNSASASVRISAGAVAVTVWKIAVPSGASVHSARNQPSTTIQSSGAYSDAT